MSVSTLGQRKSTVSASAAEGRTSLRSGGPGGGRYARATRPRPADGGTHYQCWQGTTMSCQGVPGDDKLNTRFQATAVR